MYTSADSLNLSFTFTIWSCLNPDAKIDIRKYVIDREHVEQKASVNCIHTSKNEIALCNGPYCFRCPEIRRERNNTGAYVDTLDGICQAVDFVMTRSHIVHCRIQDAVDISLFDNILIDEHQFPNTESGKLFNHRTTGS